MLCLQRKENQWVTITYKDTGKSIDVGVCNIVNGQVRLLIKDDDMNFDVMRHEAKKKD